MSRRHDPLFQGAIFDLDGLLVDSEPIWARAQKAALGELGAALSASMQRETTGLGLDAAMKLWKDWFPRVDLDPTRIRLRLLDLATGMFAQSGQAKAGVLRTLRMCGDAGCKLAVASSSTPLFIRSALAHIGAADLFQAIVSGEDETKGKPHPAVYLTAARRLGIDPAECIAFEDSLHGLRAAKAAGMYCVAVPEAANRDHPGFGIADIILASLEDFEPDRLRKTPGRTPPGQALRKSRRG
jgi:beta-phosphoglucomutase-like phosphatase (HAD superfamily)